MDLSSLEVAFQNESTPLIRTDFSDDDAWRAVIAEVTKPTDEFGDEEPVEIDGHEIVDAADHEDEGHVVLHDFRQDDPEATLEVVINGERVVVNRADVYSETYTIDGVSGERPEYDDVAEHESAEFGDDETDEFGDEDGDDGGYAPNIVVIDDRAFEGVTGARLAGNFTPSGEAFGYVVLADSRSMREVVAGAELTIDYVDLSVFPFEDEHPDDDERELGRTFRCAVGQIASVEANLSISNLDFADFADNTSADGVYRGEDVENPPLVVPEAEAGLAASVRIGRDVDGAEGARALSGALGSVESVRSIRGTRRKLFLTFARVTSWSNIVTRESSWTWGGYPTEEVGAKQWAWSTDHPDQLTGTHGAVEYSFAEVDRPRRAVRRWNWLVHPSPGVPYVDIEQWLPVLAEDSLVTVTLEESKDAHGDPWTEVRMRHDGLPVEWLDDMQAWWDLQLAIADHAGFGVPGK